MKTHTKKFKEQIKMFGRELDSKITYTLNNEEVVLGKEQLNAITPHYEGDILKSVMKQLDIDSNVEIPVGTEVNYKFGVKVREGINKWNLRDTTTTRNGITGICKDGVITLNGTATANTFLQFYLDDSFTWEVGQKYSISCFNDTNADIRLRINSSGGLDTSMVNNVNATKVFTYMGTEAGVYNDRVQLRVASGTTLTNFIIKPQMELGDTPSTSFEKGGNTYDYLDYGNYIVYSTEKQEDTRSYKIVCYDKMLYAMKDYERIENRNLLIGFSFSRTNGGVDFVYNENGTITASGTATGNPSTSITNAIINQNNWYITLEAGTYTLSGGLGSNLRVELYDSSGTRLGQSASTTATFTTTEQKQVYIRIAISTNVSVNNTFYPQLELGNTATDYRPHFNYPITLKNYLNSICYQIGLTLKDTNFVNYDKEITNELYLDSDGNSLNYTYRDVLDEIAGATASTICINEDDELEVRYINATEGRNLLKNTNTNSGDNNFWQSYSTYDKTTETLTRSTTATTESFITHKINLKNNTTYTISALMKSNGYVKNTEIFAFNSTVSKVYKTPSFNLTTDFVRYKLTFTTDDETNFTNANIRFDNNGSSVSGTEAILTIKDVMLVEGENDEYEPYGADLIDEEYLKDINVNFGEKYGPVNSVVFSRSAESDNIYRQDETSINENGLHEIKIIDNQILNGNTRENFIDGVFNQLNGFEYYANDFSSTGIAYYDLCDRYNVRVDNNIYSCIMMNDELDVSQGLEEKVHLDIPEKSETDYKKADKTDRRINETWIIANKQEGYIQALTSRTTSLEENTYTITQVNNLIQNAETGITNTFTEAGGNNIFRNTGLWFETNDENNPYEFWTGLVVKQKEDKASNLSGIVLQNSTLSQEQIVANGSYTISFKYKRLLATASLSVFINGVEYQLVDSDEINKEIEYEKVIEVQAQHINLKFVCDLNNGFEIYDLMVNSGKQKLAYSQNQNETTTDTVNISKGITITSSDTDVKFKADADGIRTLDNSGNELTKFTDEGMTTKTAIIESKSQIVGTLWQVVNGQTWITKL